MSVQNHTFNINYPNMNFGQTILQGMFGSLTGYMGMSGSIFGTGGCCGGSGMPMFGGFGVGVYSDQMIGMQIGSSIFNYGMMALGQYTQQRKAQKTTSEQLSTVESEAKTYLKTVNISSIEEFTEIKARTSFNRNDYNGKLADAKTKSLNSISSAYSKYITGGKSFTELTEEDFKSVTKTNEDGTVTKEMSDADKIAYEGYKAKLEEYKKVMSIDINTNSENVEDESIKNILVEMEEKEEAVNDAIVKLTELKESYDELQAIKTDEMINDFDGWSGSRTRKSKLNEKLVNEEGNPNNKTWDKTKKATKDDIQGALASYRKAKSPNEEQQWLSVLTNMAANKESETKGFEVLFERLGISIAS